MGSRSSDKRFGASRVRGVAGRWPRVEAVERRTMMSAATQAVFTSQPTTVVAGTDMNLTVQLQDGNGQVDPTQAEVVSLTIASGPTGANLGGFGYATAGGGVATLNLATLTKVGTYTLRASAYGLTAGLSASITVTPATARLLSLVQQPPAASGPVAAGTALGTVAVGVVDGFGNVVTNAAASSVRLTNATLVGGTTTEPIVNGVATFPDLTLTTSGNATLTFADGSFPNVTLYGPTVTAGPATTLAITGLNRTPTAGDIVSNSVDIVDAYGNLAVAAPVTVTLTTPLNTETATSIAGVATFGAVIITRAGPATFTATAPGFAAVSGVVQVAPAIPSGATFLTQPADVTAGQPMAGVTVQVTDAYGNVTHQGDWGGTEAEITGTYVDPYDPTGPGDPYDNFQSTGAVTNGQGVVLAGTMLTRAGTYTIKIGAYTSAPFHVLTGAPAKVTVSTPRNTLLTAYGDAGRPLPNVEAQVSDAYGNPVSVALPVTVTATGTTLGGTTTETTEYGNASFGNLILPAAGQYTLTFAAGTATPASISATAVPPMLPSDTVVAGKPVGLLSVDMASYFPYWTPGPKSLRGVLVKLNSDTDQSFHELAGVALIRDGRATMPIPALRKAGTYSIAITDIDGDEADTTFTVNAAAPSRVAFVAQPSIVNGDVTATVQLYDRFGNAATAAPGTTASVTISAPPVKHAAKPTLGGTVTVPFNDRGVATFAALTTPPVKHARLAVAVRGLPQARSYTFDAA